MKQLKIKNDGADFVIAQMPAEPASEVLETFMKMVGASIFTVAESVFGNEEKDEDARFKTQMKAFGIAMADVTQRVTIAELQAFKKKCLISGYIYKSDDKNQMIAVNHLNDFADPYEIHFVLFHFMKHNFGDYLKKLLGNLKDSSPEIAQKLVAQ